MTTLERYERMVIPPGTVVAPAGPAAPPWTGTFNGSDLNPLDLFIDYLPAGRVTVPVECLSVSGNVSAMTVLVRDVNGDPVVAVDPGGAVPNLPFGYMVQAGHTIRPVFDHPGGQFWLSLFPLGAVPPVTGAASWSPVEVDVAGDAAIPRGTVHEWDSVGGTYPTPYAPPAVLSKWEIDETGANLVLTAEGLEVGSEIVVPMRATAGAVTAKATVPGSFLPSLVDPAGTTPTVDGVQFAAGPLVAPRWRLLGAGDFVLTLTAADDAYKAVRFAPWVEPGGSGGPINERSWRLAQALLDASQLCGESCGRRFVTTEQSPEGPPPGACSCQLTATIIRDGYRDDEQLRSGIHRRSADVKLSLHQCRPVPGAEEIVDAVQESAFATQQAAARDLMLRGIVQATRQPAGELGRCTVGIDSAGWTLVSSAGGMSLYTMIVTVG